MLLDLHSDRSAIHLADFWSISCNRRAWREERKPGSIGLYPSGSDRRSCFCRIYRRNRYFVEKYGRLHCGIPFFRAGDVGDGDDAWEKNVGPGIVHGGRPGSLLCFWDSMVYGHICKGGGSDRAYYRSGMVRISILGSGSDQDRAGPCFEQKAGNGYKDAVMKEILEREEDENLSDKGASWDVPCFFSGKGLQQGVYRAYEKDKAGVGEKSHGLS